MRLIQISILLMGFLLSLSGCKNKAVISSEITHPRLILQKSSVEALKSGLGKYSILDASLDKARKIADQAISKGIDVPFPKDPAGGYTHVQHQFNYIAMHSAGLVYQLTSDEKYAVFVRDMLLEYALLYPTLGIHPEQKNRSPGKLFWQGLNEAVWLVYTSQAYDCIYDFITKEERFEIESNLFERMVRFFTVEDNYSFNLVHNHGTWATAGVGMAGLVLGRPEWVDQALYSTKMDGSGGFLKQIDDLFSPDGYYAEGPYYQRYALSPYLVFAQALENNRPELGIFDYKNGVLCKAVLTLMQLTNTSGHFYPINDGLKEKSWITPEMIYASNIVFSKTGDRQLLDVASKNGRVMLSLQGLEVAKGIQEGQTEPFVRKSMNILDGSEGTEGGLALLRAGNAEEQTTLLLKYASQGMGHGHFDRLGFLMYDYGNEIITDYGSVRYLNVEAKNGGRYLAENTTWAKQTIAHNTVVLNGQSHFNGKTAAAAKAHPHLLYSDYSNKEFQIVSAVDSNCYEGAVLNRTMALVHNKNGRFVIDFFRVDKQERQLPMDLALHFQGQVMSANFHYEKGASRLGVLGNDNGYQHLWVEAVGSNMNKMASACWMNNRRFYTWSFLTDQDSEFYFTRLGANDPNFNLRNEPGFVLRQKNAERHSFLSVFELHGSYDPGSELVTASSGSLADMELIFQDSEASGIRLQFVDGDIMILLIAHHPGQNLIHDFTRNDKNYHWKGNYQIIENE